MFDSVIAVRFYKRMRHCRTRPFLLGCVDHTGTELEVFTKFSATSERRTSALVAEAIASFLAADLNLPVPEPFAVQITTELVQAVSDEDFRKLANASCFYCFGSKKLPPGFSTWPRGRTVPRNLLTLAAEVFAFDALIQNPDRREENPNCLFDGTDLAIYDHDLAFFAKGIIGWKPPWEPSSLEYLRSGARHLFYQSLRGSEISLNRFSGALQAVTPERILEYRNSLPEVWVQEAQDLDDILGYIQSLTERASEAIQEVIRALR